MDKRLFITPLVWGARRRQEQRTYLTATFFDIEDIAVRTEIKDVRHQIFLELCELKQQIIMVTGNGMKVISVHYPPHISGHLTSRVETALKAAFGDGYEINVTINGRLKSGHAVYVWNRMHGSYDAICDLRLSERIEDVIAEATASYDESKFIAGAF